MNLQSPSDKLTGSTEGGLSTNISIVQKQKEQIKLIQENDYVPYECSCNDLFDELLYDLHPEINNSLQNESQQNESQRHYNKLQEMKIHHRATLKIIQQFLIRQRSRGRPKITKKLTKKLTSFWKLIPTKMIPLIIQFISKDNRQDILLRFLKIQITNDREFQNKWFPRVIKEDELIPYISKCLSPKEYIKMIQSLLSDQSINSAEYKAYINQRIPLLHMWLQEHNNLAFRNWYHLCYLKTEHRS